MPGFFVTEDGKGFEEVPDSKPSPKFTSDGKGFHQAQDTKPVLGIVESEYKRYVSYGFWLTLSPLLMNIGIAFIAILNYKDDTGIYALGIIFAIQLLLTLVAIIMPFWSLYLLTDLNNVLHMKGRGYFRGVIHALILIIVASILSIPAIGVLMNTVFS